MLKEDVEIYICSGPPGVRSLSQNAYMWLLLERVAAHTGYHRQQVHEFYKKHFAIKFETCFGVTFETSKSTSEMNKQEFMEYVELIRAHALDTLDLYLPLPNEVPDHIYVEQINSGLV